MNYLNEAFDELENLEEDWEDFNDPDWVPPTEEEEAFAKELFDMLQAEIDKNELINEEFTSYSNLERHFLRHCIGKSDKKSSRSNIYYDFTDVSQYKNHEKEITSHLSQDNTIEIVASLLDTEVVLNAFRRLFEGNTYVLFSRLCEFRNNDGEVAIGMHSFANNTTQNYASDNTIDLLILSKNMRTITMYPIALSYLETKFNNIIKKYSNLDIRFKLDDLI